jgi:drug/metabolite transporter (DMT)-like permease
MKKSQNWLLYALITTVFWGIWGAFSEIPKNEGFPGTLIYAVWSITMIVPAIFALANIKWKLETDKKSIFYGSLIGFLGAGGQLALFIGAIENGPAYLIFPIISLSPVVTIILSYLFLKERTSRRGWIGVIIAVIAIPLLSYQDPSSPVTSLLWLPFALMVLFAWGLQAYFMKHANEFMKAESIFFYMAITGLILAPIALLMTDFSQPINWGFKGPYLSFGIQILNSIGALTLVFAFRYGKAIIVSPMVNAVAPVVTVIISLVIYMVVPHPVILSGMVLAIIAIFLLSFEET